MVLTENEIIEILEATEFDADAENIEFLSECLETLDESFIRNWKEGKKNKKKRMQEYYDKYHKVASKEDSKEFYKEGKSNSKLETLTKKLENSKENKKYKAAQDEKKEAKDRLANLQSKLKSKHGFGIGVRHLENKINKLKDQLANGGYYSLKVKNAKKAYEGSKGYLKKATEAHENKKLNNEVNSIFSNNKKQSNNNTNKSSNTNTNKKP